MNHNDLTNQYPFRDSELRRAAGLVRQSMLASLSDAPADYVPSPGFRRRKEPLFARARRMEVARRWTRWAVAAALALVLGTGAWLATDADARAAFTGWVREICGDSVLYRFFSPSPASVIPTFRPTWVPEGYWEVDTVSDDTSTSILYQKGDDSTDQFIFGYMFYSSDTEFQLLLNEKSYECQTLQIHGHLAHFYLSQDPSETNNLIWFDEEDLILFQLNAPFNLDVMLHIAESINLVK